jgi:hypothetical protein
MMGSGGWLGTVGSSLEGFLKGFCLSVVLFPSGLILFGRLIVGLAMEYRLLRTS